MRTQITDQELITFFNNLKEIIQAQKELNHVLAKRITNLEERLSTNWIDQDYVVEKVRGK